ncbi:MAG: hypothetical protein H6650_13665 [Ardenticatenales bacterium]|nr:hypothetical protein [Ardenticatenales bacterium]
MRYSAQTEGAGRKKIHNHLPGSWFEPGLSLAVSFREDLRARKYIITFPEAGLSLI